MECPKRPGGAPARLAALLAGTRYAPPSEEQVEAALPVLAVSGRDLLAGAPPGWGRKPSVVPPTPKQSKRTGVVVEGVVVEGKRAFVAHEERIAKLLVAAVG